VSRARAASDAVVGPGQRAARMFEAHRMDLASNDSHQMIRVALVTFERGDDFFGLLQDSSS